MNRYMQWMSALYQIFDQVRYDGILSVEEHIDTVKSSPVFDFYHITNDTDFYELEFFRDALRFKLMLNPDDIDVWEEYVKLCLNELKTLDSYEEDLYMLIYKSLKFFINGYCPRVVLEFARNTIPFEIKPSSMELEDFLKKQRYLYRESLTKNNDSLDIRVDAFLHKINTIGIG